MGIAGTLALPRGRDDFCPNRHLEVVPRRAASTTPCQDRSVTAAEERWVERLVSAIESGDAIDLSNIAGERVWDESAHRWPRNANVPARAIRSALLSREMKADPHGLILVGARITGQCDFVGLDANDLNAAFRDCRFDEALAASGSRWRGLSLEGSHTPGVDLAFSRIDGHLRLAGLQASGEVRAPGAQISGQLRLTAARLKNPGRNALNLDGATIESDVYLDDGFRAEGEVRALGAHIAGQLNLATAELTNPGRNSLNLDGATIDGGAFLRDGFQSQGEVRALRAHISGELSFTAARLTNPGRNALNLDGATVDGGVFLDKGFKANGEVRALDAHVVGHLSLDGAELTNAGGNALNLDGANIDSNVYLDNGFEAQGEVRALGAHIAGQLSLNSATLTNPGLNALSLDGVTIEGDVFFDEGFKANGEVRAPGAHIGGQLSLTGATLTNPGRNALNLDGANIDGNVYLDNGFKAQGEVRALGAHMAGQLGLATAELTNPDGRALNLEGARIDRDVFLDNGFKAQGEVCALGVQIAGQLSLNGAELSNPNGVALNLQQSCVGSIFIKFNVASGIADLAGAEIGALATGRNPHKLPGPLRAHGWRVADIHGFLRTDHASAAKWLNTLPPGSPFSPAPWLALAEVYGRNGHPEASRRLRFKAARLTTAQAPFATKWLRRVYEILVGYGYYPALALGWLIAIAVGACALVQWQRGNFYPNSPTSYVPPLSAPLVGLSTAVPAIGPGALGSWHVTVACVDWALAGLRAFAWIMTALLLAGITGLLKKAD